MESNNIFLRMRQILRDGYFFSIFS